VRVDELGCGRVLASIEAGKRLPEARFETLGMAGTRQKSVYGLFKAAAGSGVDGRGGVVGEVRGVGGGFVMVGNRCGGG
jgi:hypothetical protein